ncbi:MAG: LytTR family transcriptional regulator [Bacteroidales bacterium]|nr:LytTR family transcriptional regulator [Bacteroidales bacterium]
MKKKTIAYFHILFWVLVVLILVLIFGQSWHSSVKAFYFVIFLLPVVMATSYFFNFFLVPKYLLKGKYFHFILYFIYTLIASLYFETLVLLVSFIYLANFNMSAMGIYSHDTIILGIVLYMVVFLGSFLLMIRQYHLNQRMITDLKEEKNKMKKGALELISNRKTARIPYEQILFIESLSDYVKVHMVQGKTVTSKEKISRVEGLLPDTFLRIHRSFIINTEQILNFNYEGVILTGDKELPIGRSYKKQVRTALMIHG